MPRVTEPAPSAPPPRACLPVCHQQDPRLASNKQVPKITAGGRGGGLTPPACSPTTKGTGSDALCLTPATTAVASASPEDPGARTRAFTGHTLSCSVLCQPADQPRDPGQQPPGWVSTAAPLPSAGICTLCTWQRSCYTSSAGVVTGAGKGPRQGAAGARSGLESCCACPWEAADRAQRTTCPPPLVPSPGLSVSPAR